MQFYDGLTESRLNKSILSCYSPYRMGNAMFMEVDLNKIEISKKGYFSTGLKLLYNQGTEVPNSL